MRRIAVLLAVGLVVAACGGSDEVSVEGTPLAPFDVVEPAVAAGEPVSDATLSCLPMDPSGWWRSNVMVRKIEDARLAANDEIVVALGRGFGVGSSPAMHHSSDGLAWEETVFPSDMELQPRDVTVAGGGKGFVVVGTTDPQDTEYGLFATPVVAFSADGTSWERVDPDTLPSPRVRWFTGVFAGPGGFLAVGTDEEGGWDNPGFVWYSDDGMTWSEADLPRLDIFAVAATDSGWAMVSVVDSFEEPYVQVWTSSEGRQWSEVETDSPPPVQAMLAYTGTAPLVADGGTWMLALQEAAEDPPIHRTPTVWVSTDSGMTWEGVIVWDDPDKAGFQVFDLTATDHGFLLAGYQDHIGERGEYFVHHSEDGRTWQHCWTGSREFTSIEVAGDSVVVFNSGTPGQMFVWREP